MKHVWIIEQGLSTSPSPGSSDARPNSPIILESGVSATRAVASVEPIAATIRARRSGLLAIDELQDHGPDDDDQDRRKDEQDEREQDFLGRLAARLLGALKPFHAHALGL